MERKPRVVVSEAEEGQEEVELLVELRLRVPDVELEVAVAVVAALVEEGVHLLRADLLEARGRHHVRRLLVVPQRPVLRRSARVERV